MSRYDENSRYRRIYDQVDVDILRRKRFGFIGCGSMGNPASLHLGRIGVGTKAPGRCFFADGDTVEEPNFIGTHYRQIHVGMPKAQATAEMLREINDQVNVTYWNHMIVEEDIPEIVRRAQQFDLLGLFADSFSLMLQISEACYDTCPQVIAAMGAGADFAEVGFSIPNVTVPLTRTFGKRQRQSISRPQALGTSTTYIADFVAELCMVLLLGNAKGHELLECYANAPLFILGLRPSWLFQNQSKDVCRIIYRVAVE